ncbi:hypothetical protein Mtc_2457 [Methanocella conradii HZ254]|uniref:Uncharacterized protein n=1 Tax=Methanocella conradii (strain DSM 24694 / JCM 17849 / CGMCC 1.5162 / HZ254) TaxID=1041930 RepID=H8I7H3_METCZ|nr:hypothetical protein [Methanocella conradii]AFD01183.1 hypothetical protein Mtc_2457 [Methanocella conradii HZ254]
MEKNVYSTLVRVLVAGIIGAAIISAGFYLILSVFEVQRQGLIQQFGGQYDMGPGALLYGLLVILLFIAGAIISGFVADFLAKRPDAAGKTGLVSSIAYSAPAGFVAGILVWLAYSLLSPLVLGDTALMASALSRLSSTLAFFMVVSLVLALISMLGGFASELISPIFRGKRRAET